MKYRLFDTEDIEKILSLFKLVWPQRMMNERIWKWKFEDVPFAKPVIALAEEDEKIVGHEAVWPLPILVDSKRFLAGQSVESMVHPSYRGKGIFNALISLTMKEGSQVGYKLFFGFPNRNSVSAYLKQGWEEKGKLIRYVKIISWKEVLRSRSYLRYFSWLSPIIEIFVGLILPSNKISHSDVKIVEEKNLPFVYETLWQEYYSKMKNTIAVDRSSAYLSWRYSIKPDSDYLYYTFIINNMPFGFIILKRDERGILKRFKVGEFVILKEELLSSVISGLEKSAKEKNASTLEFQVLNDSFLTGILKRRGYFKRPDKIPFLVKEFDKTLIGKNQWYLTCGDFDIF